MPICPNCGNVLKGGTTICSCGTVVNRSNDEELEHLLTVEAEKVKIFQEIKAKCLQAFEEGEYQKSFDYSGEALALGIGSDGELSFVRGKSLYYLNRFLDSVNCFDKYIREYKDSFYRFSNISGAYEWKAAALWQLGNGFESIKCYYKALDYVDNKPCSIDEKMDIRTRIEESRRKVLLASRGEGIGNPRLGILDEKVYDRLEGYNSDINVTMQNLYNAMDEVTSMGYEYKSLFLRNGDVYVEFSKGDETLEKCFDGTSTFKV